MFNDIIAMAAIHRTLKMTAKHSHNQCVMRSLKLSWERSDPDSGLTVDGEASSVWLLSPFSKPRLLFLFLFLWVPHEIRGMLLVMVLEECELCMDVKCCEIS